MRRFCDRCMKVHEHGERCPKAPKRAKRPDIRHNREAHRRYYATAEYKRNRQAVLTAHKGRCAKCGKQIAVRSNGAWVMRGGDIHHICALSEGGTNRKANLVPLCHACHAQVDAARNCQSFVIPRGEPQTCGLVRPLEIRNVYKVGALPSYQPEVPAKQTANAVKPRPSVADWQRTHALRMARARRLGRAVKTLGWYALGVAVLYLFLFLAALGG